MVLLGTLPFLGACHSVPIAPVGALVVADGVSVAVFGRDLIDIVVSGVSGSDCSVVRLEQRKSYCRPEESAA